MGGGSLPKSFINKAITDPQAAYLPRATAIHAKIDRLKQLADDHFGQDPDTVDWGHVGDLGRVESALDELLGICKSLSGMGHKIL